MNLITKIAGLLIFIQLFLTVSCFSDSLMKPLEVRNEYILYLPYLFLPSENSKTFKEQEKELRFNFYKSSTYYDSAYFIECGKKGTFDVETTLFSVSFIMNVAEKTDIRVVLPVYYHGGGYLDPIIENFHHLFPVPSEGLPNGGREYSANNRFLIYYDGGNGKIRIEESFYGIGDPSFYIKKQLFDGDFGISILGGVKFPFGNQPFIHSGTCDIGLSVNFDYEKHWFYAFGMIGGIYMIGESKYSQELSKNKNYLLDWALGVGFKLSSSFGIFMQVYYQSSPYHTGVNRIDKASILHSFGLRWQWLDSLLIQLSADEDTFNYATCDISLHLQTEYHF